MKAKYINSPNTEAYIKSENLIGLDTSKYSICEKGYVIIVEGFFDVISSYSVGIRNIVAAGGTHLSEFHVRLLKKYTNKVKLCFDQDEAGKKATKNAKKILNEYGVEVEEITFEGANDVDELINKAPHKWIELAGFRDKNIDLAKRINARAILKIEIMLPEIAEECHLKNFRMIKMVKEAKNKVSRVTSHAAVSIFRRALPKVCYDKIKKGEDPRHFKSIQFKINHIDAQINLEEIKKIPIKTVLDRLGVKHKNNSIYEEGEVTTAYIYDNDNRVERFSGKDGGGSVIDVVMHYMSLEFKEAIIFLNNLI